MNTVELEDLRRRAKGLSQMVLDDIVSDLKESEASSINSQGPDAQIDYIIEKGGGSYLKLVMEEEQ